MERIRMLSSSSSAGILSYLEEVSQKEDDSTLLRRLPELLIQIRQLPPETVGLEHQKVVPLLLQRCFTILLPKNGSRVIDDLSMQAISSPCRGLIQLVLYIMQFDVYRSSSAFTELLLTAGRAANLLLEKGKTTDPCRLACEFWTTVVERKGCMWVAVHVTFAEIAGTALGARLSGANSNSEDEVEEALELLHVLNRNRVLWEARMEWIHDPFCGPKVIATLVYVLVRVQQSRRQLPSEAAFKLSEIFKYGASFYSFETFFNLMWWKVMPTLVSKEEAGQAMNYFLNSVVPFWEKKWCHDSLILLILGTTTAEKFGVLDFEHLLKPLQLFVQSNLSTINRLWKEQQLRKEKRQNLRWFLQLGY